MQGFDQRLDDIIFRYHLDVFYPGYRKMRQAEKYLNVWMKKCCQLVARGEKILCVALNDTDIERFRFYTSQAELFQYYLYQGMEDSDLKNRAGAYKEIYIISYDEQEEIAKYLTAHELAFGNIYDDFAANGIEFRNVFYLFLDKKDEELNGFDNWYCGDNSFFLENYYLAKKKKEMDHPEFLKRMIFLSLAFKDFMIWKKYQLEILGCLDKDEKQIYSQAGQEIEELLEHMKTVLRQRNKKDILMVWLDALNYGLEKDMPFLNGEVENGILFENAFTVIPNTMPTFRVCFTDQKEAGVSLHSHELINAKECSLCERFKEKGYAFKVFSGYLSDVLDAEWYFGEYLDQWAPVSLLLWNAVCCLTESESPVFMMVHELPYTHAPYYTTYQNVDLLSLSYQQMKDREHYARREADEQLNFYMSLFGRDVTKIYMSDHGNGQPWERLHTFFMIKSPVLPKGVVSEMFSYSAFDKVVSQLLEGQWDPAEFTADFVCVGALPMYNAKTIRNVIKKKTVRLSAVGYSGVANKDYFYFKYNNGRELLLDRKALPCKEYNIPHRNDICSEKDLLYFRKSLHEWKVDLSDGKFQDSKYIFEILNREAHYPRKKVDVVNEWIALSGRNRIAIRMGGKHARVFYEWLTEENLKKIVCFIDQDKDCACSIFGKRIISVDEIESASLDGIILSSYDFDEELRREASNYPADICIFDVYDYLEKEGFPSRDIQLDLVGMPDSEYEVM